MLSFSAKQKISELEVAKAAMKVSSYHGSITDVKITIISVTVGECVG